MDDNDDNDYDGDDVDDDYDENSDYIYDNENDIDDGAAIAVNDKFYNIQHRKSSHAMQCHACMV